MLQANSQQTPCYGGLHCLLRPKLHRLFWTLLRVPHLSRLFGGWESVVLSAGGRGWIDCRVERSVNTELRPSCCENCCFWTQELHVFCNGNATFALRYLRWDRTTVAAKVMPSKALTVVGYAARRLELLLLVNLTFCLKQHFALYAVLCCCCLYLQRALYAMDAELLQQQDSEKGIERVLDCENVTQEGRFRWSQVLR